MADTKYGQYIYPLLYIEGYSGAAPTVGRHVPMSVNKNVFEHATHHIEIFDIVRPGTTAVPGQVTVSDGPSEASRFFGRDEKKGDKRVSTGAHYHAYEEMFLLMGTNPDDPTDLGGEVEIWLGWGPEAEKFVITKPTMILVPEGTVHPPYVYKRVDRMIKEMVIFSEKYQHYTNFPAPGFPTGYAEEILPWVNKLMKDPKRIADMEKDKYMSKQAMIEKPYEDPKWDNVQPHFSAPKPLSNTKYGKYVFPLVYISGYGSAHEMSGRHVPMSVNKNVFPLCSHHVEIFDIVREGTPHVPGRVGGASVGGPSVSSMFFGGTAGAGPQPPPLEPGKHVAHYHTNSEMFYFIGTNPDDPNDLGGEIEIYLGSGINAEKHVITKPSLVLVPGGVPHTPWVFRKVNRMMKEIVIQLLPHISHRAYGGWPPGY
ncbi:hypothetical protein ACFLXU_00775, partial [Chloroflexota bacterium]